MIVIFGTLVQNSNIPVFIFHFLKKLIFWATNGKRVEMAQNHKKLGQTLSKIHTPCDIIVIFFIFQNLIFWNLNQVKGQKWPIISICQTETLQRGSENIPRKLIYFTTLNS